MHTRIERQTDGQTHRRISKRCRDRQSMPLLDARVCVMKIGSWNYIHHHLYRRVTKALIICPVCRFKIHLTGAYTEHHGGCLGEGGGGGGRRRSHQRNSSMKRTRRGVSRLPVCLMFVSCLQSVCTSARPPCYAFLSHKKTYRRPIIGLFH